MNALLTNKFLLVEDNLEKLAETFTETDIIEEK